MHKNFTHYLVAIITLLATLSPLTSFSQYWANEEGGVYNIPAVEYNRTFHGYGSYDNTIYNKIDLQTGRSMRIINTSGSSVPLYDYLGNHIADARDDSAIGRDYDDNNKRDGGIIASSIAQIKIGNIAHTMVYCWSVNITSATGGGRRSGWMKLTDLTPSTTIKNILEANKTARMDILRAGGINNATYKEYKIISAVLPSFAAEYYLVPNRDASKSAGKAKYYYTRDDYISGLKNIPETDRQRYGVAHNNIPIDAKFYRDMGVAVVSVEIYPPSSSTPISERLKLVWGYTVTSAGEKIYSFINERTLVETVTPVPVPVPVPAPIPVPTPSGDEFIPDPEKVYYIDNLNKRVASTGQSEDSYTTSRSNTSSDVQWKFVPKNGYWHIQRAAGGIKPRLRSDNSENADMQETNSNGVYTYYHFPASTNTSGTYYITLPDGPSNYNRLQVNTDGKVRMVSDTNTGSYVSFKITEVPTSSGTKNIAPDGTVSQSSTSHGGLATRAIDKKTDGRWSQKSVTHTKNESRPHWQVKWNNLYEIDQIKIYNRTDCCADRLSNFKVFVIDDDSGKITFSKSYSGAAGSSLTVNTGGVKGNRVKIRLNGTNALSLAEVEVIGTPVASGRAATDQNSFLHAYKEIGRKVTLIWTVNGTKTPIQYEIEHSKAGGDFELLETISADENDDRKTYNFLHKYPEDGENLYRVKVIFQDGSESYLASHNITFESNGKSIAFPNPTGGRLSIDLSKHMGGEVEIYMTDFSGQVHLTKKMDKDHEQIVNLDISRFLNGFYMLSVKGENSRLISEKISLISTY